MSERLPTCEMTIKLLERSGCSKKVIQHCEIVAELAVKMAKILQGKGFNIDLRLVEIGALFHDIGRSKTHSVDHVIAGVEIAKSLALPDAIIRIIERHVGGGIPPNEAEQLSWPRKSYMPETLEERIVCYADKLVASNRKVPIEQTIAHYVRKHGKNHPSIARLKALHEEFQSLLGEF